MPRPMRIAVLGLGIGMHHCRAIMNAKGVELAAVCDTDAARRKEAQAEYGVEALRDWKHLLPRDDIDAVAVCTESGTHADFAVPIARTGKHLIIEKPADISRTRIGKITRAVEKAGVACAVCFQLRLDPCNAALKRFIESGKLGKIYSVHAALPWYRPGSYYAGKHGTWKGTWDIDGGGSLMNQGVHTVDLIQWMAGPVEQVSGFHGAYAHRIEAEDQTVAAIRFQSGAIGTLFTATCAQPDGAQTITVFGENGSFTKQGRGLARFDAGTKRDQRTMMDQFGDSSTQDAASADPMRVGSDGHLRIYEDFARAVRKGAAPAIPLSDAGHAVDIVNAIYKSGRTGKTITVAKA